MANDKQMTGKKMRTVLFVVVVAVLLLSISVPLIVLESNKREAKNLFEKEIASFISDSKFGGNTDEPAIAYSNKIIDSIGYEIKAVNVKDKIATVDFIFVDAMALAEQLGDDFDDADAYYIQAIETIDSGGAPMVQETIQLELRQDAFEVYELNPTTELLNVLSGGVLDDLQDLMADIEG